VESTGPAQVLIGNLAPIAVIGLQTLLADKGVNVIGQEEGAEDILDQARRLQPDVVLLDLDGDGARSLGERVQMVAPRTKVILWAQDETVLEVLDPAGEGPRLVVFPGGLRSELTESRRAGRVED
jgi:DNA-binding NarL/FixJ family response regulator